MRTWFFLLTVFLSAGFLFLVVSGAAEVFGAGDLVPGLILLGAGSAGLWTMVHEIYTEGRGE